MNFGAHISSAGGLERAFGRAEAETCRVMQIFTRVPSQWKVRELVAEEIAAFAAAWKKSRIKAVASHDSYLINLASPDRDLWKRSVEALREEVTRCAALNLSYLVMHPGSHVGSGEAVGIARIGLALNEILADERAAGVKILLENTAGQGHVLGARFEHLRDMMDKVLVPDRLGICFDTAHAYAAGYDLATAEGYERTWGDFSRALGLKHLRMFHLNDTEKDLGSRVDRHAHLGKGKIGRAGFARLVRDMRFAELPMILETPKDPGMDKRNLALLRRLRKETAIRLRISRGTWV